MRSLRHSFRSRLLVESLEDRLAPATFTVTNENNSGPGSLRAAINAANALPGDDRIGFNIPGSGVHRIELLSALPGITDTLTINGASQPGFNGKPRVVLNGASAGASAHGLVIRAPGSLVRSLVINEFGGDGVRIRADGCRVVGSFIGTGAASLASLGNAGAGVRIFEGATSVVIGGTDPAARNVIVANGVGILITGDGTDNNRVEGNFIGLRADGTAPLSNITGVWIEQGASANVIGGAARNVISGNDDLGIFIADAGTINNAVIGNRIGTNFDGTAALGNGADGISIQDGVELTTVADNLISGNGGNGVTVAGVATVGSVIRGNIIGLNAVGTSALPNALDGVVIKDSANTNTIGGIAPADRNTISGNLQNGVSLTGIATTGNALIGNFIGTDVTGTLDLGNAANGVLMSGGAAFNILGGTVPGTRNIISGNGLSGVFVDEFGSSFNEIQGNYLGTDVTGTLDLGNSHHGISIHLAAFTLIGGEVSEARNLISGNDRDGVFVEGPGARETRIQGNYIGTDVTGTLPLGNSENGVHITAGAIDNLIGGTDPGERNIISGNELSGIFVEGIGTTGTVIQGNYVGTDVTGTLDLGNGVNGVRTLDAGDTLIGGTTPTSRNVISGNDLIGVLIEGQATSGTIIQGNYVGIDAFGTAKLGNYLFGVMALGTTGVLVGGTSVGAANVISGNGHSEPDGDPSGCGLLLQGPNSTANVVQGNFIGTDPSGTVALGNIGDGLGVALGSTNNLIGGTTQEARNVISGNALHEIAMLSPGTSGNVIQGNLIGTDITGTVLLSTSPWSAVLLSFGASDNFIGGSTPGAGNVISGHASGAGIFIATSRNVIQGNFIGTDISGTIQLANYAGVELAPGGGENLIGGTSPGAGNVISGNIVGVSITASSFNVVQGNWIGTDVTGTLAMGNVQGGVKISHPTSNHNIIGGMELGEGNVIAHNGRGVFVVNAGSGNSALGNSISNNGGLGIDLGPEGVTPNDPNDADAGPNDLLNFPVLASAVLAGGDLLVTGSINTQQGKTLRIEFFASPTADPSGHGEGQTYLGFVTVEMGTENTVNFSQTLPASGVMPGQVITATATDELGNTSEFSLALAVS